METLKTFQAPISSRPLGAIGRFFNKKIYQVQAVSPKEAQPLLAQAAYDEGEDIHSWPSLSQIVEPNTYLGSSIADAIATKTAQCPSQ